MFTRLTLALAVAALSAALGVAAPAKVPVAPAKPVAVPFELLPTGHMAVMVKINGKGPYRLIFDTGAPLTLLSNKVAREAGLDVDGGPQSAMTLFGRTGVVKVKAFEVGTVEAADVAAIVLDHPLVEAMAKKLGPLEGIVGLPFFGRYKMTLDYQARTLTFVPNGHKPGDVTRSMEATLMRMLAGGPAAPKVLAPAGQWGLKAGKRAGDEEAGVTIREVLPGSAAAAAGLAVGDRLLTIDGRWTDSLEDLYAITAEIKPGSAVPVVVRRDGKEVELKVKPVQGL
jgi:hypothetical protein